MHSLPNRSPDLESAVGARDVLPAEGLAGHTTAALADTPATIGLVVLGWVGAGLLIALIMTRRGHDAGSWAALGIALGPLLLGLAVRWVRCERFAPSIVLSRGNHHGGDIDVLIGVTPSTSDFEPTLAQVEALDARLGLLTVACAVDFESVADDMWNERKVVAADRLRRAEVVLVDFAPSLVILPGRIDRALMRHAGSANHHQRIIRVVDD
jgi:hypothetical protein